MRCWPPTSPCCGLNRTSVGLKPAGAGQQTWVWTWRPQSNQRGIETALREALTIGDFVPQSNQRGIETRGIHPIRPAALEASIEPAWD